MVSVPENCRGVEKCANCRNAKVKVVFLKLSRLHTLLIHISACPPIESGKTMVKETIDAIAVLRMVSNAVEMGFPHNEVAATLQQLEKGTAHLPYIMCK
jgi:hypothetical protein